MKKFISLAVLAISAFVASVPASATPTLDDVYKVGNKAVNIKKAYRIQQRDALTLRIWFGVAGTDYQDLTDNTGNVLNLMKQRADWAGTWAQIGATEYWLNMGLTGHTECVTLNGGTTVYYEAGAKVAFSDSCAMATTLLNNAQQ